MLFPPITAIHGDVVGPLDSGWLTSLSSRCATSSGGECWSFRQADSLLNALTSHCSHLGKGDRSAFLRWQSYQFCCWGGTWRDACTLIDQTHVDFHYFINSTQGRIQYHLRNIFCLKSLLFINYEYGKGRIRRRREALILIGKGANILGMWCNEKRKEGPSYLRGA